MIVIHISSASQATRLRGSYATDSIAYKYPSCQIVKTYSSLSPPTHEASTPNLSPIPLSEENCCWVLSWRVSVLKRLIEVLKISLVNCELVDSGFGVGRILAGGRGLSDVSVGGIWVRIFVCCCVALCYVEIFRGLVCVCSRTVRSFGSSLIKIKSRGDDVSNLIYVQHVRFHVYGTKLGKKSTQETT